MDVVVTVGNVSHCAALALFCQAEAHPGLAAWLQFLGVMGAIGVSVVVLLVQRVADRRRASDEALQQQMSTIVLMMLAGERINALIDILKTPGFWLQVISGQSRKTIELVLHTLSTSPVHILSDATSIRSYVSVTGLLHSTAVELDHLESDMRNSSGEQSYPKIMLSYVPLFESLETQVDGFIVELAIRFPRAWQTVRKSSWAGASVGPGKAGGSLDVPAPGLGEHEPRP